MTDEQINQMIAEACGWKIFAKPLGGCGFAAYAKNPNGDPSPGIPDYCNDLNAMHEAENVLDYEQSESFADIMYNLCADQNSELENPMPWRFSVCHATARQRAEAFLRTLGKWEEVQG